MKIVQALIVIIISLYLAHGAAWGVSIVYDGFQCLNSTNPDDPTPQGTPVQSRFEVIENAGDGLYRLRATGGIPRFINNNSAVCIDSETSLGYSGIPAIDGLPQPIASANATAHFNGHDLIVVINALHTDLSFARTPFSSFNTSRIFAYTYTLIFAFNPSTSQFVLRKSVRNRGYTQTSGSTNSTIPFLETVLPSFNNELLDLPQILTPSASIEFRLE
jgi:hypothetical protein